MYAVIKTGGKQYRVAANDVIKIDKVDGKVAGAINRLPKEGEIRSNLAAGGRVEHARTDEAAVQRFVTAAASGHEPDLALSRFVGAEDHASVVVDAQSGVGGRDATQCVGQHVRRIVDELLHGKTPRGDGVGTSRHSFDIIE